MQELPEPTVRACNECPWRRDSAAGWLGPYTADEWVALAHSDAAIACHLTIEVEGQWEGGIRQCFGAAQVRRNMLKSSRNPAVFRCADADTENFFAWGNEFVDHHEKGNHHA